MADPGVPRARAAVARAHLGPVGVREHGEAHERAEALREVVRLVKVRPSLASARAACTTTWADYAPPFSRLAGTEAMITESG